MTKEIRMTRLDGLPTLSKGGYILITRNKEINGIHSNVHYHCIFDYPHAETYGLHHHDRREYTADTYERIIFEPYRFAGQVILDLSTDTINGGIFAFNVADIETGEHAFSIAYKGLDAEHKAGIFEIMTVQHVA